MRADSMTAIVPMVVIPMTVYSAHRLDDHSAGGNKPLQSFPVSVLLQPRTFRSEKEKVLPRAGNEKKRTQTQPGAPSEITRKTADSPR